MLHRGMTGDQVHTPFRWIVADEAERLGLANLVESDLYKLCLQLSDGTAWTLMAVTPSVQWVAAGSSIEKATLADIQAGTNDTKYITPKGLADTGVGPAGEIKIFAMDTPPDGYLKCNGALVSRTTYANLFAAIGEIYGAGDGSSTFALPDWRGEGIRGWDDGRGVDPGRAIGSWQADQFKSHDHLMTNNWYSGSSPNDRDSWSRTERTGNQANKFTGSAGGTETRMRNIAALICIKY